MKKIPSLLICIFVVSFFGLAVIGNAQADSRCVGLSVTDSKFAEYKCKDKGYVGATDVCKGLSVTDPKYAANNCAGQYRGATSQNTTSQNSGFDLNVKIENPLKATNIQEAIKLFMGILIKLAIPVIVFFYLYVGFSYIMALGNAEKIKKVHNMFLYTVIGTLLVLGAWTITNAIVGTINTVINP